MAGDLDSVLHLGNPASTASLVSEVANRRGMSWEVLDWARPTTMSTPIGKFLDRVSRGSVWELKFLRKRLPPKRRVHLHSALAFNQVKWALGNYTLHLHGTDIRSRLYEPQFSQRIRRAVLGADLVLYSTPDLAEHVHSVRDDASLIPVPVPVSRPVADVESFKLEKPYIFFTSRWEEVKGGESQIRAAAAIRRAIPKDIDLIGLEWGPMHKLAQSVGVKLIPKLAHDKFRAVVANSRVCIGQMAGILSASELDALANNVPIVMPLREDWYSANHPSLRNVPVLGGTDLINVDYAGLVDLVLSGLETDKSDTRSWVIEHHSPEAALDNILFAYKNR